MKKLCLCLCLCMSMCLCGCTPALPDHRERSFCATVSFENEGTRVCAEVEGLAEDGGRARLVRVTLSAPSALAGAILTEREDGPILSLEGIETPAVGLSSIWQRCALLCAEGGMREVCDTEWEGRSVRYAEIGEGQGRVCLWRDPETGIPLRVAQGEHVLTVERFLHI